MFRILVALFLSTLSAAPLFAKSYADLYPDIFAVLTPEDRALVQDLDFQQGTVTIGDGRVTLRLGDDFTYLGPKDASHVLEKIWGNPPDQPGLGMIFPVDISPLHSDGWAMELRYEDLGYVSDEDATSYDYDQLLQQMQADTATESARRVKEGYPPIELLGWAEPPRYDQTDRVLYWAKELKFDNAPEHTLNFDIRVLGRQGVLVQRFIAGMTELPRVKTDLPKVLAIASFTDGNRYTDFDPSIDKVASIGIGGLIAGKVLAKTGLLAVALIFLKKAWFLIFLPFVWLKNRLSGRRKTPDAE